MKLNIFNNWNDNIVTAGYSTDCGGYFRYRNPQDEEHYKALAKAVGLTTHRMVRVHEGHTDNILVAGNESCGEGIIKQELTDDYDALLTDSEDLMLCLVTADCVPVFLYDRVKRVIGLIHSGRIGTKKEIVYKAVMRMKQEYASDPKDIQCILGPHLCAKHHVVDKSEAVSFHEHFTFDERRRFLRTEGNLLHVDMGKAITISLVRSGVPTENIYNSRICTYEHKELYSWRRDHKPGVQMISFIFIKRS